MDIMQSLKNVTTLNEYISVTQELNRKSKSVKVQINIATVLTLKKIRSLEIEYVNKCEENGVACIVLERLLALPPSKTWTMLGKELICLIQYWLEAIRKHLMNHSHNWWTFLRKLLTFIKDICVKAPCMPNLLVEHTAECLLDLATADQPDALQRYEILHRLNLYCAESSREIRFAMRNKFSDYFIKLSAKMATCGYLPYQYSTLECLIRWLVPRRERSLRNAAANKWFPLHLYPQDAVQIFLKSTWLNFFQDSRDFLNAVNNANGLVTSVICRRLSIGNTVVISGSETQQSWLDINSNDKSLSVLFLPRVLDQLVSAEHRACEALHIHTSITENAQLYGDSNIILLIKTTKAPSVSPSAVSVSDERCVTIYISSRTDLRKMDAALRDIFGDKYQASLDLNSQVSLSPPRSSNKGKHDSMSATDDETRFSHPVEVKKRRQIGYISRSRIPRGVNTPSSASTSSLAQLHEKLAVLPRLKFDIEPVKVCVEPQLSSVTELSERDDYSIHSAATLQFRRYGVCHKNLKTVTGKKSQSDSETVENRPNLCRTLSPIISDDSTSLLAVATGGNLIQNDTVKHQSRIQNCDNQNIVDRIIEEALQTDKLPDSGINTDENKKSQETENSEAIEGTPVNINEKPKRNRKIKHKVCTVITTDDESNTEVVYETPTFVNVRNRCNKEIPDTDLGKTSEVNTVENFFSQHFSETIRHETVISPTLARKINETSSESEHFDDNYLIMNDNLNTDEELFQFNDIDIIECLNDIVDKVCTDLDKCTAYSSKEVNLDNAKEVQVDKEPILTKTPKKQLKLNKNQLPKSKKPQSKKADIKIKLKTPKKKKGKRVISKKVKSIEKTPKKMSTIIEQTEESVVDENESVKVNQRSPIHKSKLNEKKDTQINRRKRKLYSPNNDNIEIESAPKRSDTDDDEVLANFKTKTKPSSSASCYKEIVKERKRYTRSKPRRSGKNIAEPPSPRTVQKNTIFDHLKETVENTENITLADRNTNVEVYNFTSESEDEDFAKKKIEIKKRVSTTTLTSVYSVTSNRPGRGKTRGNYSESKSSNDEAKIKKPTVKRRQTKRRTEASKRKTVTTAVVESVADLVDERMRDTTDVLNTSFFMKPTEQEQSRDIEPMIKAHHEMESAEIEPEESIARKQKPKRTEIIRVKKEKATKNELKLQKNKLEVVPDKDEDRTISPLPGLVVEVAPQPKQDANDSLNNNLLQKFKRIYQEGPNVNETNTTQNMLSDVEKISNNSQQNISVTEQLYVALRDEITVDEDNNRSKKANINNADRKSAKEYKARKQDVMEICSISDRNSNVTISSNGITAHGDMEEDPPRPASIKENLENREIVDLSQSMKNYFENITRVMQETSIDFEQSKSSASIKSVQKKQFDKNTSSEKTPVALLKRTSIEEMTNTKTSFRSKQSRNTNPIEGVHENKLNKCNSSSDKSPTVSLKRLSMDDIRRYLPSHRSSETDSSNSDTNETTKKASQNLEKKDTTTNIGQKTNKKVIEKSNNTSESSNSPAESRARISLEEFNKWFPPMPTDRESDDNKPTQLQNKRNSGNLKTVIVNDKENTSHQRDRNLRPSSQDDIIDKPLLRSFTKKLATPSRSNTDVSANQAEELKGRRFLRSFTKKQITSSQLNTEEIVHKNPKLTSNVTRKCDIISPVKSFEDFAQHLLQSDHASDVECFKTKKNKSKPKTRPRKDSTILAISQEHRHSKSPEKQSTRHSLKRVSSPVHKSGKKPRHDDVVTLDISQESRPSKSPMKESRTERASPVLNRLKSEKQGTRRSLKRASSPIHKPTHDDVVTIESETSVSSVYDWLKKSEPRSKDPTQPFNEVLENIYEKLETTCVENYRNTKKKLVHLVVETRAKLDHEKEERRKLFERLDNKNNEIMDNLIKQVIEIMKEDCNKKRAMDTLIKEDVEALLQRRN